MARGAKSMGVPMCVSTMATTSLGEQLDPWACGSVFQHYMRVCPILMSPIFPDAEDTMQAWNSTRCEHIPRGSSVSAEAGPSMWFQLYVLTDKRFNERIVRLAESLGYTALVVTVDAPVLGRREADERNAFRLPPGMQLKNIGEMCIHKRDVYPVRDGHIGDTCMPMSRASI